MGLAESVGEWLGELCRDGIYGTAGQAYAWDGAAEVDLALGATGLGTALGSDAVAEVYCHTKPIVAMAALIACEGSGLDVGVPLRRVLPGAAGLDDDVSVATILAHRSRLQWPSGLHWTTARVEDRPEVADLVQLPAGSHGYSEVAGWVVLVALIERLTGVAAGAFLGAVVTGPLGIAAEVLLEPDAMQAALAEGRVVVNQAGLPTTALPMWHVAQAGYLRRASVAFGGMASARARGRFGRALLRALAGEAVPGLPTPATLARCRSLAPADPRPDATWLRPAGFALGFERTVTPAGEQLHLSSHLSTAGITLDLASGTCSAFTLNGVNLAIDEITACRAQLAACVAGAAVGAP